MKTRTFYAIGLNVHVNRRHYSWEIYNNEAKVVPVHAMKEYVWGGGGNKGQLNAILTSALDEDEWPATAKVATLTTGKRTSGTH